jgi:hypothetical protein
MTEGEILQFKAGKLEVHCRKFELVQRQPSEPRRIIGPGRIYQEPDGTVRLTAYPENIPRIKYESLPLGTPVPEDRYWDLAGNDRSGRLWSAERLYLQVDQGALPWRPIECQLRALRREDLFREPYNGSQFTGYIFRSLAIDPNANTERTMTRPDAWSKGGSADIMRFPIGELQVDIRQEQEAGYTMIDVATDGVLPERFEQRFLEAVRFVFARPVSWSATVTSADTQQLTYLRGQPVQDRDTHFRQPIPHNVVGARDWMGELLRRYYLHVVKDTRAGWHPLSIWWSEVLRAGSREMESLVLIAAVAVEGVCKAIIEAGQLPPGIQTVPADVAAEWQKRVATELERLECPQRMRNRIDGLFPKMPQVGAGDILVALQSLGALDKELVQLWKDVRNDVAHGAGARWSNATRITRDADGLVTLLRQLTFWWVGYRGWYTSLDPGGWRLREYAPAAAP